MARKDLPTYEETVSRPEESGFDFGSVVKGVNSFFDKGLFNNTKDVIGSTVESAGKYAASAAESLTESSESFGSGLARAVKGDFQGASEDLRNSRKSLINGMLNVGGAAASGAESVVAAPVFGALQTYAPSAMESVGNAYNGAVSYAKLVNDETGNQLSESAVNALTDVTIALVTYGAGKAAVRTKNAFKRTELESSIEKGINQLETKQNVTEAHLNEIGDRLKELSDEKGRKLTEYDVNKVVGEVVGEKATVSTKSINWDAVEGDNAVPNDVFSAVEEAVGTRKSMKSSSKRELVTRISEENGIPLKKAREIVNSRLSDNRQLEVSSLDDATAMRKSMDVLMGASEIGKTFEGKSRSIKFDTGESLVKSEALYELEKRGLVERSLSEDGLYSFQLTEKGTGLADRATRAKIANSGGLAHMEQSLYDKVRARDVEVPYLKPKEEADFDAVIKSLDNPDTIGQTLNRIDESYDARSSQAKTTSRMLHERIMEGVGDAEKTGEPLSANVRADIAALGKRLGIDWEVWDYNGDIDYAKYQKFSKEIDVAKKFNYSPAKKIPVPNSLRNSMRRDRALAEDAFRLGKAEASGIYRKKISELREAQKVATEENKAVFQSKIDSLMEKSRTEKDWRKSIVSTVKSLGTKGSNYEWYGTTADKAKILYNLSGALKEVRNMAHYDRLVDRTATEIQLANKEAIGRKISALLKHYANEETPKGKSKKSITMEMRTILEGVSKKYDEFYATADVSKLKEAYDFLRVVQEEGRSRFKIAKRLSRQEAAVDASEIRKERLRSIDIDYDAKPTEQLLKKSHYAFINNHRQIMEIVGGNMDSKVLSHVNDIDEGDRMRADIESGFERNIAKILSDPELNKESVLQDVGEYMFLSQGDMNRRLFDENGDWKPKFTIRRVGKKFATEAEFNSYFERIKERVESNPKLVDAVSIARKLISETLEKRRVIEATYDGSVSGEVENYYKTKISRDVFPENEQLDWHELEDGTIAKRQLGFLDGFRKSRTYGDVEVDPNFVSDMRSFINTQVRYNEIRPPIENFLASIREGALSDLNKYSKSVIKEYLQDRMRPEILPPSIANTLMSVISGNALAFNPSPVVKQYLVLGDALTYLNRNELFQGIKGSLDLSLGEKARKASSYLRHSYGMDFTFNDLDAFSPTTKFGKGLKSYNEIGMWLMKKSDAVTKSQIWMGAYLKKLNELGSTNLNINDLRDFTDQKAIDYADNVTQLVASSKDPARVPKALRTQVGRAVFQLQSVLINRYGLVTSDLPLIYRKDKMKGVTAASALVASSLLEIMTGPAVKTGVGLMLAKIAGEEAPSFMQNLTGANGSETDANSVIETIALGLLKNVPGFGNVVSAIQYGGSGVGIIDLGINLMKDAASVYKKSKDDTKNYEFDQLVIDLASTVSRFVGGYPARLLMQRAKGGRQEPKTKQKPGYKKAKTVTKRKFENDR